MWDLMYTHFCHDEHNPLVRCKVAGLNRFQFLLDQRRLLKGYAMLFAPPNAQRPVSYTWRASDSFQI
jgi:hypothetical protein